MLVQALCYRKFKEPALPIGAAGGTASFYRLVPEEEERSHEEWLGKDLYHAFDELEFYEAAKSLRGKPDWALLDFMIEYAGSLKDFGVRWSDSEVQTLDLLVMRSLIEGCEKPRLLDLKIGSKTSAPHWKGKSVMASWKQGILDSLTNSAAEGLRLEGFLNPPHWIESEDPLHDLGATSMLARGKAKKARRFYFQRMSTAEALAALMDFRELDETDKDKLHDDSFLRPAECAELALLAVVRDLSNMLRDCRRLPVPQKWIGSSVAVVAEAGRYLQRPEKGVQSPGSFVHNACVRIFDWGRSELNTPALDATFTEAQRHDRQDFWSHYQAGVTRLLWEAARLYWNTFCVPQWASLRVTVYDYDSQTQDDLLGAAEVQLPSEAAGEVDLALPLHTPAGAAVLGEDKQPSTVNLKVSFHSSTAPSRLRGTWRVRVLNATHLQAADWGATKSTSDPFAVIALQSAPSATEKAERVQAQARTAVINDTLNPKWDEVLDFPVAQASTAPLPVEGCGAAGESELGQVLVGTGQTVASATMARLLPRCHGLSSTEEVPQEEDECLRAFVEQFFDARPVLPASDSLTSATVKMEL